MFGRLALGGVGALLLAVVVGGSLSAGSWREAHALTNCDTATMDLSGAEQQLLTLINAERQKNGLNPLLPSPNLSRAAAWMSEDLTATSRFDHTDSLGRSPFTRVQHCGYGSSGAGENLARTSSAQSAFNLWMGSDGHRSNMLNSRWTVVGIGQAGSIWTADFGSLNDSGQTWTPPAATATPTSPGGFFTPTSPAFTATKPALAATATPSPTPSPTPGPPPILRRAALQMISTD